MADPKLAEIENRGTDAERSAAYKEEMLVALAPVSEIIQRAKSDGFIITFGIGDGPLGKAQVVTLFVDRRYGLK